MLLTQEVRFSVPATFEACAIIRERVDEIAGRLPFNSDDRDDIRLAVGEAASNAIKHGAKNHPLSEVCVCCWYSDCEMGIEVEDCGEGFDPKLVHDPDFGKFPEGGMGIFYMKNVMDDVKFSFESGTKVTLVKKFHTV